MSTFVLSKPNLTEMNIKHAHTLTIKRSMKDDMCQGVALLLLNYYWIILTSNMVGDSGRAGNTYPYRVPDVTPIHIASVKSCFPYLQFLCFIFLFGR